VPDPVCCLAPYDSAFSNFHSFERADVIRYVTILPDEQCASDPMPTWLLKVYAGNLAPFLRQLFDALKLTFESA
jgi:hypothetical protein